MRKLYFLLILCIPAVGLWAAEALVPASVSCRTDILQPETTRSDSSKLSIRSDASAAKSWIKFDLSAYDSADIRGAELRVTLHEGESDSESFDVSAVNDDYTTNIDWAEDDITWNNAPANDTDNWSDVLATAAALMGTVTMPAGSAGGDQFKVDVTAALQADTDGIVQFVLHNGSALINCATHDHPAGDAYYPTLIITLPPPGADFPDPAIDEVVASALPSLSWTNPDPNDGVSAITCDVYLGTEPNELAMDMVTLAPGASSVAVNTTNFPTYGSLVNDTTYYWFVDCRDPSREPELIPGEMWSFFVGQAPMVDAGPDQVVWLDPDEATVDLDGTTSDDGAYTVLWSQVDNGAPAVAISPDNVDDTSVTFTERGEYEFALTADDGVLSASATVRVVVGDTSCDASHLETGEPYNAADQNQDCVVNLLDFVALIANDWLNCTDMLTNCN